MGFLSAHSPATAFFFVKRTPPTRPQKASKAERSWGNAVMIRRTPEFWTTQGVCSLAFQHAEGTL